MTKSTKKSGTPAENAGNKGASRPARKARPKPDAKAPSTSPRSDTKQSRLIAALKRKNGATLKEMVKVTGWQPHSVRGAISSALKKKLGLKVISEKIDSRGRVYRIKADG